MSVNVRVYLNKSVREENDFSSTTAECFLFGDRLCSRKDLYYSDKFDLEDALPKAIRRHLAYISVKVHFPDTHLNRELGIYKYGGVRATLDRSVYGKGSYYELTMRGKDLVQLRNLYEAIRAGTRRPTISFEGKQKESRSVMADRIAELELRLLEVASAHTSIREASILLQEQGLQGSKKKRTNATCKAIRLIVPACRKIDQVFAIDSIRE